MADFSKIKKQMQNFFFPLTAGFSKSNIQLFILSFSFLLGAVGLREQVLVLVITVLWTVWYFCSLFLAIFFLLLF